MVLRALTPINGNSGKQTGTGFLEMNSSVFGGVMVSTDGTNAATITVRKSSENMETDGEVIFDYIGLQAGLITAPFRGMKYLYFSVSGDGAYAQFFEWQE